MGFTKLDSKILQSSIMAEDSNTFKIFVTFLACCEYDGVARVSALYLSSVCKLDIEIVNASIKKLESHDEYSRSTNDEGRRIVRIEGGYKIINYLKYREYTYSESPSAIRQRRCRGKNNKGAQNDLSDGNEVPEREVGGSGGENSSDEEKSGKEKIIALAKELYDYYPNRDKNSSNNRPTGKGGKDLKRIIKIIESGYPMEKALKKYVDECEEALCCIKNLTTFLNNLPDEKSLEDSGDEDDSPPPPSPFVTEDMYDAIYARDKQ